MMKFTLDLPCRDVITNINHTIYVMERDYCFKIMSHVGSNHIRISISTSPGMRENTLYATPVRNNSNYLLQSITSDADVFINKKLIVRYAKENKI